MAFLQSELGADPVIVEGLLRAPLARVYRAWTRPEEIVKWFGLKAGAMVSAEIDLRVGGRWVFLMEEGPAGRALLQGEYLQIETEKLLQFSWYHLREDADGRREETAASLVTVTFREEGAATHIRLRHEGIARREGRLGVGHGWDATFAHLEAWLSSP